jgi:general secretion pathway protein H
MLLGERAPPRIAGFTLVELLVVLVIMGLLLAFIPATLAGISGARIRASARDLVNDLREAHAAALRLDDEIDLSIDLRRMSYRMSGQAAERSLALFDEIEVQAPGTAARQNPIQLRFFPDGSSSGGTIRLRRGGSETVVVVTWASGRAYLVE